MSVDDRLGSRRHLFLLRIALGTVYLAHSVVPAADLGYSPAPGTSRSSLASASPPWLADSRLRREAAGGVLLVLGHPGARWVASSASCHRLLGAIVWVHGANGWVFTATGGGWEYRPT